MKKFPKIRRIGHNENNGILAEGYAVVQEKLDGANFRFAWDDDQGRIVFGSRNVVYKDEKDTAKAFEHAVEFVRETVDYDTLQTFNARYPNFTVYGEAMHPHTLDYDWENTPSFIGFDVWDDEAGWWECPQKTMCALSLPAAPVVYEGPINEYVPQDGTLKPGILPDSEYRDGPPEGIVIKNTEQGKRAKYRTPEFKEKHGGQNPAKDDASGYDNDYSRLAHEVTTEARVKKEIAKMRDQGHTVEMSMMEDLWRRVYDDVIDEEYEYLLGGNHVIDTKEFRSEVASITANVLQTILERPDDSVLNDGVL